MAKLIIHTEKKSQEEIELRRLLETAALPPEKRWKKAFEMMALAMMFKPPGSVIKKPEGKGIIIKKKKKS
jgi:hypothetical protein